MRVALVVLVLAAACGGEAAGPDGPLDPGAPPPCNELANDGFDVATFTANEDAPQATGGLIRDGTYVMAAATAFVGADGPQQPARGYRGKMVISGDAFQAVLSVDGGPDIRSAGTVAVDGLGLQLSPTCADALEHPYLGGQYSMREDILGVAVADPVTGVTTHWGHWLR